jgi:hypothetical protein
MTYYQNVDKKRRPNPPVINICPHCEREFVVGVDGIEIGCDDCMGITRNPADGTIIEDYSTSELIPAEGERS